MPLCFHRLPLTLIALGLAVGIASAEPTISNRAPAPDEWGYRPADGADVRLNPPSLTWVHEPDAASYTVQIQVATKRDFEDAPTIPGIPWPTY